MNLLSDKHKEYLEKNLRPVAISFTRNTLDEEDTSILFYLYCIDESDTKKEKHFIDILEICPDTESIIFNYVLAKEQILELLTIIYNMASDNEIDKYVIKGLYKLLAVMCIEYKYDSQIKIDDFVGEKVEIKDGLFSEIINSINVYFELYNKKTIPEKEAKLVDAEEYELGEEDSLEEYAVNLNRIEYKYDPAVGREEEIKDALVSLMQGSCILVGEPGVGKTAIVEGIAYRIKNGLVPDSLKDKEIYEVSSTGLVSGCRYVGDLEEKMKELLNDVMLRENVILFFDEMHTAIGTGKGSEGTLDIANIIKPYIDRGQIKMIGATTNDEYEEHIAKDPAFRRRLEKNVIKEPTDDKLYQILDNYINGEVIETEITFNDKKINRDLLIKKLIELTSKSHRNYIVIEYNPGLAISIIKKAFSYAMYYDHAELEISDIVEAVDKCSYLYEPPKDRFKERKNSLNAEDVKEKVITRKLIKFPKC